MGKLERRAALMLLAMYVVLFAYQMVLQHRGMKWLERQAMIESGR